MIAGRIKLGEIALWIQTTPQVTEPQPVSFFPLSYRPHMAHKTCCPTGILPVSLDYTPKGEMVQLGDGVDAYFSGKAGAKPGIILVYDIFGLDYPQVKQIADRLADAGFAALVPDYCVESSTGKVWARNRFSLVNGSCIFGRHPYPDIHTGVALSASSPITACTAPASGARDSFPAMSPLCPECVPCCSVHVGSSLWARRVAQVPSTVHTHNPSFWRP